LVLVCLSLRRGIRPAVLLVALVHPRRGIAAVAFIRARLNILILGCGARLLGPRLFGGRRTIAFLRVHWTESVPLLLPILRLVGARGLISACLFVVGAILIFGPFLLMYLGLLILLRP